MIKIYKKQQKTTNEKCQKYIKINEKTLKVYVKRN